MVERAAPLGQAAPSGRCADLAARIVAAHAAHNHSVDDGGPALLCRVYQTLAVIAAEHPPAAVRQPAVAVSQSVFPDFLVCLEDGQPSCLLKRHLRTAHGMTPAQYRIRWDLPDDYPMVPLELSAKRSACARATGLGYNRRDVIANRLTKTNETPAPDVAETAHGGVAD